MFWVSMSRILVLGFLGSKRLLPTNGSRTMIRIFSVPSVSGSTSPLQRRWVVVWQPQVTTLRLETWLEMEGDRKGRHEEKDDRWINGNDHF